MPEADGALYFDEDLQCICLAGAHTERGYAEKGYEAPVAGHLWKWDAGKWTRLNFITQPSWTWQSQRWLVYDSKRRCLVAVYAPGGHPDDGIEMWECHGLEWSKVSDEQKLNWSTSFALCFDAARGRVIRFGGTTYEPERATDSSHWEWDGKVWTEVKLGKMPPPRASANMCYDTKRQCTVMFGGQSAGILRLADTWEYGPED
jgi:hypothetical protein